MLSLALHLLVASVLPHVAPNAVQQPTVTIERLPTVSVSSVAKPDPAQAPAVSAKAIGIWDPSRKAFLYSKNVDTVRPTASVAKLMTAYLVAKSSIDLSSTLTILPQDNDSEGSRLSIPTGAKVTVRDLFYASMVESANNATEALVRATGVKEAEFVRQMNATAAKLGMKHTTFTDVTGLGDSNVTTVRDLTLLADAAFSVPLIADATTTRSYTVHELSNKKNIVVRNTDGLVGSDLRVLGSKTGFTGKAGGNLVTRIRGNGEHVLDVIVLGSANQKTRISDTRALADWVFSATKW